LIDNGCEFTNKKFIKFCKAKDIILLHGRPRNPQTQGAVERYNRMIKDLIKTKFIKNQALGLDFNISKELEYANNVYNNI